MPSKRSVSAMSAMTTQSSSTPTNLELAAQQNQDTNESSIKVGTRFSNVESGVVTNISHKNGKKWFHVQTESGALMLSGGAIVMDTFKFASESTQTVYCSRSTIVDVMNLVGSHLVYVKFLKLNGSEREMYCKILPSMGNRFGRTDVMEQIISEPVKTGDKHCVKYQKRQVDRRTLLELRYNGVYYIVKSKKTKITPKSRKKK